MSNMQINKSGKKAAGKAGAKTGNKVKKKTQRVSKTSVKKGEKSKEDYKMKFDIGTIKHLGLQMYSTLPPVIGELVSNAWDANATRVEIQIPTVPIDDQSEIIVKDNGLGMSDRDVRKAYLVVGRDRRKADGKETTPAPFKRRIQGRKGIGKFSGFGIAKEIEIETVKGKEISRFKMNYDELEKHAEDREITMPPLLPTGKIRKGTLITLRHIAKFKTRSIDVQNIRRGLARRFSIIGEQNKFQVVINHKPITPEERDLKRLLDKDADGNLYVWEYANEEIKLGTGWRVSGWIGALDRTSELDDGIQRGIVVMARGKMVQAPFVFDATVGQQYALSYIVGELHAEFVDEVEDTVGTTRNSLVWDTEANAAFKKWGEKEVNKIAREWGEKRRKDNERALAKNSLYVTFTQEAERFGNARVKKVADQLIKEVVRQNPVGDEKSLKPVIQMCLDFMEFDAFHEMAQELNEAEVQDAGRIVELFREWELVEAKEMMRVTEGRIATIEKLQNLIETNALEVPTLHNFLKEFPWVLDPRWTLVADEVTYSKLLRDKFPESSDVPEDDRRIDFLCVKESNNLVVVEIKRPRSRASKKQLDQIEDYVNFVRAYVSDTTDPDLKSREVVGYLLCGGLVNTGEVREKKKNLDQANIFVRRYDDLLRMVQSNHSEFLSRYDKLRKAKLGQQKPQTSSRKTKKPQRSKRKSKPPSRKR